MMTQVERRAELIKYSDSYYNDNVSLVPDHIFDELQKLYFEDYEDEELKSTIGSPISRASAWEKANHHIPMGSLDKVTDEDEFLKWYSTLKGETIVISEKLDGISISLEYEDGNLVRGITRGDGIVGEDITVNVSKMKGFPKKLNTKMSVSVRGEIILLENDFNSIVELQKLRGDDPLKNPRNGASGKARDREGIYCGYLTIKCYDTSLEMDKFLQMSWLENNSFDTPNWRCMPDKNSILKMYEYYESERRAELNYEIDGLVLELNDFTSRKQLGYDKHGNPKFARAFKFISLKAKTIIEDIDWSLGKSGTLTPVAVLEPVNMGGVTVSRASLANLNIFNELKLCLYDEVIVSRRGDVIPHVESISRKDNGNRSFNYPSNCPECNSRLVVDDKFLRCENENCRGAIIGGIMKWIEKSGMAGKGIGNATVERLVDNKLINSPDHLYTLEVEDFLDMGGFQIRSATKMVNIIQAHKEISLADFVGGLNLGHFGSSLVQRIIDAKKYETFGQLLDLHSTDIIKIDGFGESRAIDFVFEINKKKKLGYALLINGVTIKKELKMDDMEGRLMDKSFCFTGAIQKVGDDGKRFTRKMMEAVVIKNGGDVSSVKKGLTYLVQADPSSQSTKTKKALNFGVEILSEENFFNMIGE